MVQDDFWGHNGGVDEESREIAHDDWYHDGGDDEESPEVAIFNPFSRGHNGGEDEDPRG